MTTAYTSLLGLALPVTGELSGTWGDTVNNSITSLLDSAVAGTTTLSSDADVTLTTTTGASNTSRQAIILWTAGGTVTRNITAPAQSKIYTVINKSSSTQSIVLRGAGPTTGVTIVQGESAVCAWNGSDFIKISNTSGAGVFTTLSVSGAVTLSGGTANGVAYLNGSKVLTTGSALTFDGTILSVDSTGAVALSLARSGGTAANQIIRFLQGASTPYWACGVGSDDSWGVARNTAAINSTAFFKVLSTGDAVVNGITVGRGAGAVATNTAVGASALAANTTGERSTAVGFNALAAYTQTGLTGNTAVGYNSMALTTTGTSNTAVGDRALTANTTGAQNTAVGFVAMAANTTGSANTALGRQALTTATTALDNTAIGYRSLYSTDTGSYNVAVGREALNSNTTASNNTAVGYQAIYTNTTGSGLTAVGKSALFSSTTGADNNAFGLEVLYANTTGYSNSAFGGATTFVAPAMRYNTTGYNNSAFGNGALASNTTGANNVAVGHTTMYGNTTGGQNTVIGQNALNSNTTGSNNTALGYLALYSNTTTASSVAVGYEAMFANTSGDRNTAVGYQASRSTTTGRQNTAVGYQAFYTNTTGNYNAAFGELALNSSTTGDGSVAFGYRALSSSTTGTNTAFGFNAGGSVTTGADCTFVGYNAGVFTTALTTGQQSVFIGAYCRGSGATVNSEFVLGYNLAAKGTQTFFVGGTSGAYNSANVTTWSTTSDRRLKKNIVDNNIGLDKITAIRVRNFEYRLPEEVDAELKPTDAIQKSGVQLGVIAQELNEVLPECIKTESTGVMSVNADNLTWYMVNAIKELSAKVQALEAQLNQGA